jgi:Tfp pilus assembly PilM family ATPase
MKWRKGTSRTPIGVHVDGRSIAAVQLERAAGAWRITAATMLNRTGAGAHLDAAEVRRLADVLVRQGFVGSKVNLAAPREKILSGVLDLPRGDSGAPLDQIARTELARMHKCEPDAIELAYWNLPARARAMDGTQVMAAACSTADTAALLEAFESQGFDVRAIDVQSWAMARACEGKIAALQAVGLLQMDWDASLLVLLYQGVVVYERILGDAGLKHLCDAVAAKLGVDVDVAKFMLERDGVSTAGATAGDGSDAAEILAAMTAHFETMIREVQISCSYLVHRHAEGAPQRVLLLGCGAALPGMPEHLAGHLEIPVQRVRPSELAACPPSLESLCENPALVTAIGLAQHGE